MRVAILFAAFIVGRHRTTALVTLIVGLALTYTALWLVGDVGSDLITTLAE